MSEEDRHKLEEASTAPSVINDSDGHTATTHDPEADTDRAVPGGAAVGDDDAARREMSRRSRRSFLVMGIAAAGGIAGWRWLQSSADADGIHTPLRAAHEFNARLSGAYFSDARLAPTFARELAREPRVNGGEGMSEDFDPALWRLQVIGLANPSAYPQYREDVAYETATGGDGAADESVAQGDSKNSKEAKGGAPGGGDQSPAPTKEVKEDKEPGLLLTLDDIRALPRVEMTTELKCIEGWSVVVNWAGARLSDFAAKYQPPARGGGAPDVRGRPQDLVRYVGLETPDGGYYVGMDMPSALHPQTLLCYEMNGLPLTPEHGAPLRLVTPVKYGIKHIKRIGRITFTDERPDDFWAERGYDWYSGH